MANTIIESEDVKKAKGYVITPLTAEQIEETLKYAYGNFVAPSKNNNTLIIDNGNASEFITPNPTNSNQK